jgi:hypothetical protein
MAAAITAAAASDSVSGVYLVAAALGLALTVELLYLASRRLPGIAPRLLISPG